jgi:hypothetical protein
VKGYFIMMRGGAKSFPCRPVIKMDIMEIGIVFSNFCVVVVVVVVMVVVVVISVIISP